MRPDALGALGRLWIVAAALCAGALVGAWIRPAPSLAALAAVGLLALARRRSAAALAGACALAFSVGSLSASWREARGSPIEAIAQRVPACELRGRIVEGAGGLGTLLAVTDARCSGFQPVEDAGVVMLDAAIGEAGGLVEAEGWLLPLGDDGFSQARRRLGAAAAFEVVDATARPPRQVVFSVAAAVRGGLRAVVEPLPSGQGALLLGLTVGDTRRLDAATLDDFRRAGLSHLVAVSGTNVAIVLAAVSIAARALAFKLRIALGAAAIGLFVLVVGPEASVLRAALMGAVGLVALVSGRRAEPLHALGISLMVLVAARPGMVLSVGLHLSAAATGGLILWTPLLARRLPGPRPLVVAMSATLAAQGAVAPILAATFGELSIIAPLANPLAAPAVAPATVLGLAAGVTGLVSPWLGGLVARAAGPFAGWILWVGELCGSASWASIEMSRWWGAVLAVPVVGAAVATLMQRNGDGYRRRHERVPLDASRRRRHPSAQ